MQIAVVILNWNAAPDTIRCVRQFSHWQQIQPQIWVIDNASTDSSAVAIAQHCPHVHLISNPANIGFAGGTNQGIQAALAASDAPILFLNNDALVEETALIQLLTTLTQDASIGVVGPLLYHAEAQERLIVAGSRNPVLHLHSQIKTVPQGLPVYPVDYISGSVALWRAALFRTAGLLDEDYFFYTEVADLCRRARQHGYQTVVDSRARAYHNLDRSAALRSTLYVYYLIRNRFVYIRKAYRILQWPLLGVWALYSGLLAAKLKVSGQAATAQAVRLGLIDGLRGRWGGQNARVLAACSRAAAGGVHP